jgi:hypothetical protein
LSLGWYDWPVVLSCIARVWNPLSVFAIAASCVGATAGAQLIERANTVAVSRSTIILQERILRDRSWRLLNLEIYVVKLIFGG